jgi:hypothetical protein
LESCPASGLEASSRIVQASHDRERHFEEPHLGEKEQLEQEKE